MLWDEAFPDARRGTASEGHRRGRHEAINIAANGVFYDQPNGGGAQLGFYYGDEQSDLGSWDNRISSFRVEN